MLLCWNEMANTASGILDVASPAWNHVEVAVKDSLASDGSDVQANGEPMDGIVLLNHCISKLANEGVASQQLIL
jgi:hypothetical protein